MAENYLYIRDLVNFNFTSPDLVKVQDDLRDNPIPSSGGLEVTIAATHAGIITRNNGFYLPDKMREGASTFLDNYGKPILTHHKSDEDAIGRVVRSEYVDLSQNVTKQFRGMPIKNSLGRDIGTINDSLIEDFNTGKMPFAMQIDVIRNIFTDNILGDKNYEGMGFVKLVANITDKDAIQKIMDGRYLTGSVGAKTDKAVCSICKTDWVDTGSACDHKPGAMYDKAKCYIIAGKLNYDEYSFVNKPADRHSKVLELNYNGIKNSIDIANEYNSRIYDVTLEFPQYHKEDIMSLTVTDNEGETPIVAPSTVEAVASASEQAPLPIEEFDVFITRVLSLTDSINDEDEEKLYSLILNEMKEAGLTDQEINDAKLSTESRKKLAGSTFCGPGRSFPVPDCAHVTAARRLIGRYQGEGSKDSILSCVSRKAKSMGCGASDKVVDTIKEIPAFDPVSVLDLTKLTTVEQIKSVFDAIVVEAKKREMNILKDLVKTEETSLLDEIVKLETQLGELREKLVSEKETTQAVRDEYSALMQDVNNLNDTLVNEKVVTRTTKEKYVGLLINLKDTKVDNHQDLFTKLSDNALDIEMDKLGKEIDMKKITDKLGDGTSRIPNGTVQNPAAVIIQDKEVIDNKDTVVEDQEFAKNYLFIDKNYGRNKAEAFRLLHLKQKESKKLPTAK